LKEPIGDPKPIGASADNAWEISPYVVFGMLGFTLYLTWIFMLYFSPTVSPENILFAIHGESQTPLRHLIRFAQIIGLIVTLIFSRQFSDRLSTGGGVRLMVISSLLMNGLSLTLLLLGQFPAVPFIAYALIGIAQGFTILLWSSFLSIIGEHRILLLTAICVGAAGFLTLIMSFLQPIMAVFVAFSLSFLTIACFFILHYRLTASPKPLLVKAKVSDKRYSIPPKSALAVVFYSVAIGFSTCFIAGSNSGIFGAAASAIATSLAAVLVAWDSTRLHLLNESLLIRLHLPAVILGLTPFFFDDLALQVLGAALLICFFSIIYIINLSALSEHVRIDHLNSIRVFGFGRAGNSLGFFLGAIACWLAFFMPQALGADAAARDPNLTIIILLVLLALFIAGVSFIFEDHYPITENGRLARSKPAPQIALPVNDLKSLTTAMLAAPEESQPFKTGIWTKRINALSAECGLSPKETEVLFLLAKGRNAEYIQNELVVSRHTAKAHIYHIYQKTGVHSRQDLINMLENMDVDDD
jgi:DNA-binding CsgD family transcriptional regulator